MDMVARIEGLSPNGDCEASPLGDAAQSVRDRASKGEVCPPFLPMVPPFEVHD